MDWKNYPVPVGVVIAGAMAWLYISSAYVHAEDYKQYQQQQTTQVQELRIEQLILQRDALSSQLFDLEYRLRDVEDPHPDDLKRLDQLEQQIADIEEKIEHIRTEEYLYGDE